MHLYSDFGFNKCRRFEAFNIEKIGESITRKRPVMISGLHPKTPIDTVQSGHFWICDGHYYNQKVKDDYFHYNWGFDGDCNGYFKADVFQPSSDYLPFIDIEYLIVDYE